MCGIIGYIGNKDACELIIAGLKSLEYRGYDSAGIAVAHSGKLEIRKAEGKIDSLIGKKLFENVAGTRGIGHTRWATHGAPSDENAHPHFDCTKTVAIVHNGIIENYTELRDELKSQKHKFISETDTECIAHLLEGKKDLFAALKELHKKLKGSFAILAISAHDNALYAIRESSPLIIGIAKDELIFASDVPAVLAHTNKVVILEDGDIVKAQDGRYEIYNAHAKNGVERKVRTIDWTYDMAQKGGYAHFMLKEIHEQGIAVRNALKSDIRAAVEFVKNATEIEVVACGTSYHAGLVFQYIMKGLTHKKVSAYIASEYPYTNCSSQGTVAIAISQSGETADTLNAVKIAKANGAKIIAVTNVIGSSLDRLADATCLLYAGPEISVVATKTFIAQLTVLYRIAFECIGKKGGLEEVANVIEDVLTKESEYKKLAQEMKDEEHFFFIGRGIAYPIAMEAALKLKEITYKHAESYAAGELKHGPLSLISDGIPVIAIAPKDETFQKTVNNLEECMARKGKGIAVSEQEIPKARLIRMPAVEAIYAPMVYIVPMQMLAYYIAVANGKDPDRPRNLAKSVTVE